MARTRPIQTTAGQLSLDEWAETVTSTSEASERARHPSSDAAAGQGTRHQPAARELLEMPGALLTRTHLRELGLERRAVDAVFRVLPVVALPGYSRPMIRVRDYLELLDHRTFRDDRVRPIARAS